MEGLDGLIERLLEGRKNRGKRIQLAESEIRQLCIAAKDVFLSQPNLLELEAPVNVCGTPTFLVLYFLRYFCIFYSWFSTSYRFPFVALRN